MRMRKGPLPYVGMGPRMVNPALGTGLQRAHSMSISVLPEVYTAIVIAKLRYTLSAWWGFTSADDRQHLDGFIRHSIRQGYCASDYWHNISSRQAVSLNFT